MKSSVFSKTLAVILSVSTLASSMVASALEIETIDQPIVADQTIITTSSWKDKIQPYLLEVMEKETGKIPVWLWMEDIDHEEAEQEVFARTGLNEANLSVISEPLSQELASEVANLSEADSVTKNEVKEEFQKYLDRTEEARKLEAERVDTYMSELRDVKKEMITEKSSLIFNTLGISEKDVISKDTMAPVYSVYLDKKDIERLAQNPKVTAIYYYNMNPVEVNDGSSLPETVDASSVSRIHSELGLTGTGVKLGIIEGGVIQDSTDLDISRVHFIDADLDVVADHSHVTNVTRVAAGNDGVAPSAEIYYSNQSLEESMKSLADNDVHVANYAISIVRRSNSAPYDDLEMYVDYFSRNYKFLLVKTAGNRRIYVGSPGLAYNVLTVGGFYNYGTTNPSDDMMFDKSNYDNYGDDGCAKPDIIADMCSIDGGTGTSYSAPFVTGTIALLYELCPSLQIQPEAVRAILMSSCHRKVTPHPETVDGVDYEGNVTSTFQGPTETMEEGITEHQGAGAIDPYMAIAIAGSGNYGYRTMGSTVTSETIRFKQPAYASTGMNVSIAWSVNNPDSETAGPEIDLDLYLLRGSSIIKYSELANSSAEMVYVAPSSTETDYKLQIDRYSSTGTTVRYAYAFSVDNYRYQYPTDLVEGVYYIKNRATGLYLSNSNNYAYQKAFTGGAEQQWLIDDSILHSVSTENGKLSIGSSLNTTYKRAAISSTGTSVLFQRNAISNDYGNTDYDGTVSFVNLNSQNILGIYNQSSTAGTAAAWRSYSTQNEYLEWYLEPIAYQRGDVNIDGIININDSNLILSYLTSSETLSDIEKYLADVNGDGIISTSDSFMIQQIAAGNL